MSFFLRLDVIDRIIKAFSTSESNELTSKDKVGDINTTPVQTPPLSTSAKRKKAMNESKQISLLDMVRHLNVRLKLQHFVVTSWISRYHLKLIITTIAINII